MGFVGNVLLFLLASTALAFPSYDDPRSLEPEHTRPDGQKCVVTLFSNVTSSYNQVARSLYAPPTSACFGSVTSGWSKVLLDWNAHIAGLQFDRVGALWIGSVEVLRTTTPEPGWYCPFC